MLLIIISFGGCAPKTQQDPIDSVRRVEFVAKYKKCGRTPPLNRAAMHALQNDPHVGSKENVSSRDINDVIIKNHIEQLEAEVNCYRKQAE